MTFNMKVKRRVFLLWCALYLNWMVVHAGHLVKNHHRLRLNASKEYRIYKPSQHVSSKRSKGLSNLVHTSAGSNVSVLENSKRAFIQRRIQLKGAPKGVVVNVNGQKIYSSAGRTILPQPGQGPEVNKAINLHINLSKKPSEFSRPQRKQQPIIIAAPRPQQPMRPIVISVPPQTQPQQPVVMPAPPLPPPVVLPAPLPQPAPAPEKEENDLGDILQTVALLSSLGKKEESPPKIIPVPVPAMGYPVQGYPGGTQNQGYPAGGNQGYPSQNQGYPAGGSPNQGYPAGGNQNQGYPAGGNQNQGYPAGGSPNQGYPAGGSVNPQGYPAGAPLGAPPTAGNGATTGVGTPGATSALAGLSGILPLLLPMNCRCGCERRCPDLCGLCKNVDEEIIDTLECCKTVPCPCSAAVTQQGAATQPAAVTPQQGTAVAVPQNQQTGALPVTAPNTAQPQPIQMSSPPLQPPAPVQHPLQSLSAPTLPSSPPLNPIPPASASSLPRLTPGSVIPPPAPQPSSSGPAAVPGALPPLPPLPPTPEITPPKPEITPPKPEITPPTPAVTPPKAAVTPPKPEIPGPGIAGPASGSVTPPKPEIVPPVINPPPKEGPVPPLPPGPQGPGSSGSPGEPGSSIAPPPDNAGPIKIPPVSVLPGDSENKPSPPSPPLPALPLLKPADRAPPPPPQVFIIKENSASSKDPEDSKSAEALDNLSKTFEDAFTEAYKSEKKQVRLGDEPRRGRFRQRLEEQDISDIDSDESRRGRFRQHEQDNSDLDSDIDSEDDVVGNSEDDDDEERMRSRVGSRREFGDNNATEGYENNEETDDDVSDNADDDVDINDDDGRDNNNDDYDDNKVLDSNPDTEPSHDADKPRQSHSHYQPYHEEHGYWKSTRHRSEKQNQFLSFQEYEKGIEQHKDHHGRLHLSHKKPNRFVKYQRVNSRTHEKSHPTSKNTDEKETSRKHVFYSSRDFQHERNPPWSTLRPRKHLTGRTKTTKKLKHRLKLQYHPQKNSKLLAIHDASNFAHFQDNESAKHNRQHARQHHTHHHEQYNYRYSHQHGHHNSHQHGHKYSHSKTETIIPEDEISESSAFSEGSANMEDERSASAKSEETISSSKYDEDSHYLTEKNIDVNKGLKSLLSTVQSFKPKAHHKLLKQNNKIEDGNDSSGEESSGDEVSDTEGSEYY